MIGAGAYREEGFMDRLEIAKTILLGNAAFWKYWRTEASEVLPAHMQERKGMFSSPHGVFSEETMDMLREFNEFAGI